MTLAEELMGEIPVFTAKGRIVNVMPTFEEDPRILNEANARRKAEAQARAHEVLKLMVEGHKKTAIAEKLGLSLTSINRLLKAQQ